LSEPISVWLVDGETEAGKRAVAINDYSPKTSEVPDSLLKGKGAFKLQGKSAETYSAKERGGSSPCRRGPRRVKGLKKEKPLSF